MSVGQRTSASARLLLQAGVCVVVVAIVAGLDQPFATWCAAQWHRLTWFDKLATLTGGRWAALSIWFALLCVLAAKAARERLRSVLVALFAPVAGLIAAWCFLFAYTSLVPHYVRQRPFVLLGVPPLAPHAADMAFPSDCAVIVAACCCVAGSYLNRRAAVIWTLAAFHCAARCYTGVHWLTDVFVGGPLFGSPAAFALMALVRSVGRGDAGQPLRESDAAPTTIWRWHAAAKRTLAAICGKPAGDGSIIVALANMRLGMAALCGIYVIIQLNDSKIAMGDVAPRVAFAVLYTIYAIVTWHRERAPAAQAGGHRTSWAPPVRATALQRHDPLFVTIDVLAASVWIVLSGSPDNDFLGMPFLVPLAMMAELGRRRRRWWRLGFGGVALAVAVSSAVSTFDSAWRQQASPPQPTIISRFIVNGPGSSPKSLLSDLGAQEGRLRKVGYDLLLHALLRVIVLWIVGYALVRRRDYQEQYAKTLAALDLLSVRSYGAYEQAAIALHWNEQESHGVFDRVRAYYYRAHDKRFVLVAQRGMGTIKCIGDMLGRDDYCTDLLINSEDHTLLHVTSDMRENDVEYDRYCKGNAPNWLDILLVDDDGVFGKISADNAIRHLSITEADKGAARLVVETSIQAIKDDARSRRTGQVLAGLGQLLRAADVTDGTQTNRDAVPGTVLTALTAHMGCCFDRAIWYSRKDDELIPIHAIGHLDVTESARIQGEVQDWTTGRLVEALQSRQYAPDEQLLRFCLDQAPIVFGDEGAWLLPLQVSSSQEGPLRDVLQALGCEHSWVLPLRSSQGLFGLIIAQSPYNPHPIDLADDIFSLLALVAGHLWMAFQRAQDFNLLAGLSDHDLCKYVADARLRWQEIGTENEEPQDSRLMDAALGAAMLATETLSELAMLVRSEVGHSSTRVSVDQIVDDAVEVVRHRFGGDRSRDGSVLRRELAPGLYVQANRHVLATVVANVLDNAFRYKATGSIVTASCSPNPGSEDCQLVLTISNDGPPIDSSITRSHSPRRLRGLQICIELMHRIGGSLEVSPHDGKGCRVSLHLPAPKEQPRGKCDV